jgi:hypothetical protein
MRKTRVLIQLPMFLDVFGLGVSERELGGTRGPTELLSTTLSSDGQEARFDKRELAHAQTYVASRLAMAGVTEGTIANLLRHSGTSLVRRYAHLSPSYLQEAVEKVSSFGKAKAPERTKAEETGKESAREERATLIGVSTVPKTGKSGGGMEGQ